MARPPVEVADIFRRYGPLYRARHRLPPHQLKLMRAIENCRTAALGGHVERCGHCHYQRICYNSCRNRHCPKCQNLARAQWVEQRKRELLPVDYFHVVFTLPAELHPLALSNRRTLYRILFQTSAETLDTIARDPKHLGAQIGFFSILHTWGQNLLFHPHLHCVVTGGGWNAAQQRWIACRRGFFLSVRVLSRLFRRLFRQALLKAFEKQELQFPKNIAALADEGAFQRLLTALGAKEWVVYAKAPFAGPQKVIDYLGRYTHRVAISNHRLLAFDADRIRFRYKQYRSNNRHRQRHMTLGAEEFIRRFLLHALPHGFQRIRHYGLLASSRKKTLLPLCRQSLHAIPPQQSPAGDDAPAGKLIAELERCPVCRTGRMFRIQTLPGQPPPAPGRMDSS